MMEYLVGILLLCGGSLAFAAALGIARLPDIFVRMHASTKAGTLGAGLIMVAVALYSPDTGTALRALLTSLFLLLTAPVSAHIVGRTAYRTGARLWRNTWLDELENACRTEGEETAGTMPTAPEECKMQD
jgi:multicomponent Na+:H+ antiporter subunit G